MEALDAILTGITDVLSSTYGYEAIVAFSTIMIFDHTPHEHIYIIQFQFNKEGFLEIDQAGLNNKMCFFDLNDPKTTIELLAEAVHSLCPRKLDNFLHK